MSQVIGLRHKIFLALAALALIFGGALSVFVKLEFSTSLRRELEKRGVSIARHIARQNVDRILARDRLALKIAAQQQKQAEEDIVYIFFLGTLTDDVLAHTFDDDFPFDLVGANSLPPGADHSIRELATERGAIYDVVVPVAGGGLGQVRLGISAAPLTATINLLTGEILLVTLFLAGAGIIAGAPLSAAIARPLRELTGAAEAVAHGDLTPQVREQGRDEFGQLARAFNFMTRQLQEARESLLARNRDLGAEVERRQLAEDRLADQLNFLSTLMNELPTPVFSKDTRGAYLGCNRSFEEFFGLARGGAVGLSTADLIPAEDNQCHLQADQDLLARPGTCRYETDIHNRDGKLRHVIIHKATFLDRVGQLAGIVGIIIDVTEEREVDRLRSEFVSTAAHEFQTPLTAILGFCELIQESTHNPPDSAGEYLAIIQERAEFLSRLVDQFLDVSRIEAGRALPLAPRPCQPETLVRRTLRNFHHGGDHRFEFRFPDGCPEILADPDRLGQVLENLLSNAVKYSPAGSRITLSGEVEDGFFRFRVKDQGTGLAPEQAARIFDKFFRANTGNTAPSGTGLGLYISRAIVEAHGGRIEAHSIPGGGTCISLTVPLAGAATRAGAVAT